MEKLNTVLSGVSGEYFVAAELSRRGYIASITLRNTKGVDILCSNSEATKTISIQVKTNSGSTRSWILNQKVEAFCDENLFYIFVNLNDSGKQPDFFIVPSKEVSRYCKEGHRAWLSAPGKKGQKHIDTTMRKFNDPEEKYLNRWDLLGL
ncbi:MAG: hypothetical protein V1743_07190 [Nanoarchaeota archaeon]